MLLRRLRCQEDLSFKIFGPPSAGTIGGPWEEGATAKPPLPPPSNTSLWAGGYSPFVLSDVVNRVAPRHLLLASRGGAGGGDPEDRAAAAEGGPRGPQGRAREGEGGARRGPRPHGGGDQAMPGAGAEARPVHIQRAGACPQTRSAQPRHPACRFRAWLEAGHGGTRPLPPPPPRPQSEPLSCAQWVSNSKPFYNTVKAE